MQKRLMQIYFYKSRFSEFGAIAIYSSLFIDKLKTELTMN